MEERELNWPAVESTMSKHLDQHAFAFSTSGDEIRHLLLGEIVYLLLGHLEGPEVAHHLPLFLVEADHPLHALASARVDAEVQRSGV